MQILIHKGEIRGIVQAPSSKSYTIRGLMCAALAKGQSELWQPLASDDTEAAKRVLSQIGVRIQQAPDRWVVEGGHFQTPEGDLFCGDSAATLRFLSAICALVPGRCKLTAGPSLSRRPVKTLIEALRQWRVDIYTQGEATPVIINGGELTGGHTELPGDISSQYVSALLLIAPLAEKASNIWLTTPLESKSYVLMTIECLRKFGVDIQYADELMEYEISPQVYKPARYKVEGDWSSASYLLGLGAIAGEIKVSNLDLRSLQGDKSIVDFLDEMGAEVEAAAESITVKRKQLKAIKADLNNCIDLLPTMSVLAALAEGTSEFTGIQRARLKESNRVKAIKEGLKRAGIKVIEELDKLTIKGGAPREAIIDSQNDHRIAMAFSLMGIATGKITITGAECISKTYPEYWKVLQNLGVKIDER